MVDPSRIARLTNTLDRIGERVEQVDLAIQRHGGPEQLRESFVRRAEAVVHHIEESVAQLTAIEGEVIERPAAATAIEPEVARDAVGPSTPSTPVRRRYVAVGAALLAVAAVVLVRRSRR